MRGSYYKYGRAAGRIIHSYHLLLQVLPTVLVATVPCVIGRTSSSH